jgi:hypothetical protein
MEATSELNGRVSALEASVDGLKEWQRSQNGHLVRTEAKVDKLLYWIMTEMAAIVILAFGILLKR